MVEQWQIKAVDAAAHLHRQAEMSSEPVASVSASLNPPHNNNNNSTGAERRRREEQRRVRRRDEARG